MDGYQFVHIEGYARKSDANGRSVAFILDEAERSPASCCHVDAPLPPEVIFGLPLNELRETHDANAAAARCNLAGGKSRKVRQDQMTLLTVVASHPAEMQEVRDNTATAEAVAAWESRVVDWLRAEWGEAVVSVVRHVDESHAHLHAYVLPVDSEMRARRLHPGAAAKETAKTAAVAGGADAKTANAVGDKQYLAAMRAFQDGFWQSVGLPSGLARIGPARRRLTRAAWHAEKLAIQSAANALQKADEAEKASLAAQQKAAEVVLAASAEREAAAALAARASEAAERARAAMAQAKAITATAQAQQAAAEKEARQALVRARQIVTEAGAEARRLLGSARVEASQMQRRARGIGAWFGSLFHGLRGVHPSRVAIKAAANARAAERESAQALIATARNDASRVETRLRDTEQKLVAVSQSTASISRHRDALTAEIATLRAALPSESPCLAPKPTPP